MYKATAYLAAALTLCAVLVGCVPTRVAVSNSIPFEVQQNIRTAEGTTVGYRFVPHEGSDEVTTSIGGATVRYPVNGPMRGLFQELIESKFANIDDGASDRITIHLTNVQHSTSGTSHTLEMTARITTVKDGTENSRDLSYSETFAAQDRGSQYTIAYGLPSSELQAFMLKFVVAADRFIDSNFGIR